MFHPILHPLACLGVIFLVICGVLTGSASLSLGADIIISGTVSLPQNQAAPSGGIDVDINVYSSPIGWYENTVTIAQGQSSANYSINVSDDAAASWTVSYSYQGNDYLRNGYYATSGTTWNSSDATSLPGGQNHTGINLTLLSGKIISGSISLSDGDSPPTDGISVEVDVRSATGIGYGYGAGGQSAWYEMNDINITQSDPQPEYEFRVPNDSNLSFEVNYRLWLWGNNDLPYLDKGYFQSPTITTWIEDNGSPVSGGTDHNDINLTLIRAKTISGSLSLPNGQTAHDDMCFTINAKSAQGSFARRMGIESNQTDGDYTIKIPDDGNVGWKIFFNHLESCQWWSPPTDYPYWGVGFYADGHTVLHEEDAASLQGGQDYTDIDMTVSEGYTLSGSITLPDNRTASNDIKLFIRAEIKGSSNNDPMHPGFGYGYGAPMTFADESLVYRSITIPRGQSSTSYTLTISPETNIEWNVQYTCTEGCSGYNSPGYYKTNTETTDNPALATPLQGGEEHSGINLILLKKNEHLSFPVRSKDGKVVIITL